MAGKTIKPKREKEANPKGGRPPVDVDPEQIKNMARLQCTAEEICEVLMISRSVLFAKYGEEFRQGTTEGKANLRRLQFRSASKGNAAVLIFLGKQYLGQKDRVEVDRGVEGRVSDADVDRILNKVKEDRKSKSSFKTPAKKRVAKKRVAKKAAKKRPAVKSTKSASGGQPPATSND